MEDVLRLETVPGSSDKEQRVSQLEKPVFTIVEDTLAKILLLKFFECSGLNFAKINYKEVHEHVLLLGVEDDCVENEVQLETEEVK